MSRFGVEDQFYLFWPLLVMLSARLLGVRRRWWVIRAGLCLGAGRS